MRQKMAIALRWLWNIAGVISGTYLFHVSPAWLQWVWGIAAGWILAEITRDFREFFMAGLDVIRRIDDPTIMRQAFAEAERQRQEEASRER